VIARGRTPSRLRRDTLEVLLATGLLLLVAAALTLAELANAHQATVQFDSADSIQRDSLRLLVGMVNQETGVRGYTNTANPVFLEPYTLGQGQAASAFASLESRTQGTVARALLTRLASARSDWESWARVRVAAVENAGRPSVEVAASDEGKQRFDRFRRLQDQFDQEVSARRGEAAARVANSQVALLVTLALAGVFIAVVLVVLGVGILGLILDPLVALAGAAGAIAGGRDTPIPGLQRRDEVGELARALRNWREAEARRRQAELARDALVEHAPLAFGSVAPDGRLLDVNPRLCEQLGYTREELLRLSAAHVTDDEDVEANGRLYAEMAAGVRNRGVLEKRYRRKDGSTFWGELTVAPVRDAEGRLQYFVSAMTDITERRARQEAESARDALIQHAPLGIEKVSPEGVLLDVNPAFSSMLGFTNEELVGSDFAAITGQEDLEGTRRLFAAASAGDEGRLALEKRYLRKDGTSFWGELTVAPVRDAAGRPLYFVAMVEDISERKAKAARAAEIQRELLPREPPTLDGYDLAGLCVLCEEVGGDFYDFYPTSGGELAITLGDVMGKGMPAAILMAMVRTAMRAGSAEGRPADTLNQMATTAALDLEHSESFVTLFHGLLHEQSGRLRYIDAGHGYAFIVARDGLVTRLDRREPPLGVLPDRRYSEGAATLPPEGTLVVFSDGVVDIHPELERDMPELGRLVAGASSARAVVEDLSRVPDGWTPKDDVTVLVVRRLASAVPSAGPPHPGP
jgi:PAS domain S-box-containing protein